ncbi:MAG: MFS transporter, partial [Aggregatilineales bacterium]
MQSEQVNTDVRHNVTVNLLDGAFFGLGLGISSYTTILPLFIALMTDSAMLVGLVAAMHAIGWQFPQLFTSGLVSRQRRYKPAVVLLTSIERLPYFALALLALALPVLSNNVALILTFPVIVLLAFGGGFTATAWQSMLGKIIPPRILGRFYGAQSATANLLLSVGAVIAGFILGENPQHTDFALCFMLSGIFMCVSWVFIALSRETPHEPLEKQKRNSGEFRAKIMQMLNQDSNLRWFMVARVLALFAQTAIGFYAIYGAKQLGA